MSMGWSQRTTTLNVRNVSFSDHDLLMRKAGIANRLQMGLVNLILSKLNVFSCASMKVVQAAESEE